LAIGVLEAVVVASVGVVIVRAGSALAAEPRG
jgi:hypothetical protein